MVGCLVALPVLRLRGIYLALCTLAFAILMDGLVFGNSRVLGGGETLAVPRPTIFGIALTSEQAMFVLTAAAVALYANVFLAVRRSSFGRMLVGAARLPHRQPDDGHGHRRHEAARVRAVGAAGRRRRRPARCPPGPGGRRSTSSYFRSLTVLLVATIFGITSVSGALLGAAFFVVLPEVLRELGSGGGGGVTGSAGPPAAHHRRCWPSPPPAGPRGWPASSAPGCHLRLDPRDPRRADAVAGDAVRGRRAPRRWSPVRERWCGPT